MNAILDFFHGLSFVESVVLITVVAVAVVIILFVLNQVGALEEFEEKNGQLTAFDCEEFPSYRDQMKYQRCMVYRVRYKRHGKNELFYVRTPQCFAELPDTMKRIMFTQLFRREYEHTVRVLNYSDMCL